MRWKLLVIASFGTAIIACGLWSALVIGLFGTARDFARNDWLLLSSAILPLAIAAYSGVFVYRHTARRRKTQAALTVILALLFTAGTYLAASLMFPNRLCIPRTYELRHAR
jgi:cytochrome bd-type quinol oxidase subunit 2